MRFTPEVGVGLIRLKGKPLGEVNSAFDPSACSSISAIGALKVSVALASCLEMNITPEYYYSVYKTDIYKALHGISPSIPGWGEGLKLNVGVGIFF